MKKYKFKIENHTYEWDNQFISGAEVRSVGPGIPNNMDLFLKEKGKAGRLIKDNDTVDLSEQSGIEKFYTQEATSTPGA
jgi:hypothetical protein